MANVKTLNETAHAAEDDLSNRKEADKLSIESTAYKQDIKQKRRTRLEKLVLVLLVCALVAVIVLAVQVANQMHTNDTTCLASATERTESIETPERTICLTPTCVTSAARVIQSIDDSVDPCDNFYDFACGGWMKKHVIPSDKGNIFTYGQMRDDVSLTLKGLLEKEIQEDDIESIRKVKHLFQSCVNEDLIEERNVSVMYELLQRLGGWPLLGNNTSGEWNEKEFDMGHLLVSLHTYNNQPIIPVWVGLDDKNNSRRIIFIDQTWFGMPDREYFLDDILTMMKTAYRQLMYNVAVMLGADATTVSAEIDAVVELETQLANISMKKEERRDSEKLYNKMTISELQNNFTPADNIQFDWLIFLQGAMQVPDKKVNITADEEIILVAIPYFQRLFHVLQRFPKRTIANYMIWRIVKNRVVNLPKRFRDEMQTYNKVLYGTPSSPSRWKVCVKYIQVTWELVVGRMFVQHTFSNKSKVEALDMINNTRAAFHEILNDLDWMDDDMKLVANEKADTIIAIVGYPEFIFNDTTLNNLYENMTMDSDKYFENVLAILQMDGKDTLGKLREPNVGDRARWTTSPTTVNAFYSSQRNQITFPAGILQPPYFHIDQPRSMNYGGIGFLMGHEITHGFDDTGRLYDKNGNLLNWWTPLSETLFKDRARCLIDQYSRFVSPEAGIHVNGINTQGENIADNGGIKQAFKAYRKWVATRGREEPLLPGVDFSNNQLFFLNFAQIRCGLSRKEDAYNHVLTGAHSPNRFRIMGSLQNMPEFSEAFKCAMNTTMNPEEKCSVW